MAGSALLQFIEMALSDNYDPVSALVEHENVFDPSAEVIRPGHALLPHCDWREAVVSLSGTGARIVLVHARRSGAGAFTRLLAALSSKGVSPVVIDPTREFAAALTRRGWRGQNYGASFDSYESRWRPCVLSPCNTRNSE